MGYYIGGVLILSLFFLAIVAMLAVNYKICADAAIEENRLKEQAKRARIAHKMAVKMANEAIRNAQFTVNIVAVNESDIEWGEDDEM